MSEIKKESGLGLAIVEKKGELAIATMAATAKAQVEARYIIAMNRPRNIMDARASILDACCRPRFAESARYSKPVGSGKVTGFSVRFAEAAIQCMRNIQVDTKTVFEDDDMRTVQITVTDLESNLSYGKDITLSKTVERSSVKEGTVIVGQRTNTNGNKVYIVRATEDELSNKIAAAESKIIRNCGLRLIPQDILDEAEEQIAATLKKGGEDPKAETKKICDSFSCINVRPAELEKYIGHALDTISKSELIELREVYSSIKEGESSWNDFLQAKVSARGGEDEDPKPTTKADKILNRLEPKTATPVIPVAPPPDNLVLTAEPPSLCEQLRITAAEYVYKQEQVLAMMAQIGRAPKSAKTFEELTDENALWLRDNFDDLVSGKAAKK